MAMVRTQEVSDAEGRRRFLVKHTNDSSSLRDAAIAAKVFRAAAPAKGVWRQLPGWRKSFMPKIGQRVSDAQPRSNSPARTPAVNASHSAGAKISFGPSGSLE